MRRQPEPTAVARPRGIREALHSLLLTTVVVGISSIIVIVDVVLAIVTMGRSCGPTEY